MVTSVPFLRRKRRAAQRGERAAGFARNDGGAAAVEFALIAIPFFAIIFAIVESALLFWSQQILDTALTDAVRQVYTGQFQRANSASTGTTALDALRNLMCPKDAAGNQLRTTIFQCANVKLDVRSFASFPGGMPDSPILNGAINPSFGQYQCPAPGQIALVRAVVEFPVFVKLLNPNLANLSNGNRLLMATAAFQTEPYGGQCPPGS